MTNPLHKHDSNMKMPRACLSRLKKWSGAAKTATNQKGKIMDQIRPDEPLIWLGITLLFGILAMASFKSGRVEVKFLEQFTRVDTPVPYWTLVGTQTFIAAYAAIMYLILFTFSG